MRDFKQKKKIQKRVYSKGVLVILAVVAVFLGNATWNVYQKYQEAEEKTVITENQLEKLKAREIQLSASLSALNTKEGVERELREKFGVVKDGEQMILIVEGESGDSASSTAGNAVSRAWRNMWNFLFH